MYKKCPLLSKSNRRYVGQGFGSGAQMEEPFHRHHRDDARPRWLRMRSVQQYLDEQIHFGFFGKDLDFCVLDQPVV